jgi:hypothetical protein
MVRNKHLAYDISDAGIGMFYTMLAYKCNWYGINLVKIDRFKPSSKPVTTALKSPTVWGFFTSRENTISERTQLSTQTVTSSGARHPNSKAPASVVGKRARITSSMIRLVDRPL